MVRKIDNSKIEIAKEIYSIFQRSYKIEAQLLNATDFPPLKRPVSKFLNCNNEFFGYYLKKAIAGVIEIENKKNIIHIQSLVVDPKHFRKGIGKELIKFVLTNYTSHIFTVETGIKNYPAISLYNSFHFKEENQWDTNHGVRKIRFIKKM
mgnify:CR=1 FL=1